MKHMTEAVDQVRKSEHRRLQAEGDETLKRTKYLWLYSEENLPESAREKFAAMRSLHWKTGRAWAIKESLRDLWRLSAQGVGLAALEALVLLGDALAVAAGDQGGADDPGGPGQRADLLRASDHQRHERGAELEDPDGKKN